MKKISGKGRASFRWIFSCAIIGLAVSVLPCYAQESRSVSQENEQLQRVQEQLQRMLEMEKRRAEEVEAARQAQRKMQGLPVGVSPLPAPPAPVLCDSLLPKGCFELLRDRMKQTQEHILHEEPDLFKLHPLNEPERALHPK